MPNLDFDEREKEKIRENKTYDKFDLHEPRNKVPEKEIVKEKRLEIEIPIEKEISVSQNIYDESRREKFNHGECAILTDEKGLRKDTKPWIKSLDAKEKLAVTLYTGSLFYAGINKCLRENKEMNKIQKFIDENLFNALEKSSLPRNMILYRKAILKEIGVSSPENIKALIGTYITLKSYSSTSVNPERKVIGETRRLLWEIDACKGAKAAYLKDLSLHRGEAEVLLQKGTRLMILGVDERKEIIVVHAAIGGKSNEK